MRTQLTQGVLSLGLLLFFFTGSPNLNGQTLIISQYVETNSGSTPKGIELWNPTSTAVVLSATNQLEVYKGTNGGTPTVDFTLSSGTIPPGAVIIIGTADMDLSGVCGCCQYQSEPFTFNGDDALRIELGGVVTDIFGTPGTDPGGAWSGSGVSTANQNIALLSTITTGSTSAWSDPSLRFSTVAGGTDLTGFGEPPMGCPSCDPPTLSATTTSTCPSLSGGAIDLSTAGGTGTFTYVWSGPTGFTDPGTQDLTGLAAGTYDVTVTVGGDASCTETGSYTVSEFTVATVESGSYGPFCENVGDITLTGTPAPGTSGTWTGALVTDASTADATAIFNPATSNGDFTVTYTVVDDNGCVASDSDEFAVYHVPEISITKIDPTGCGLSNGSFTISGMSVSFSYVVTYTGTAGTPASGSTVVANTAGEITISGLGAGSYTGITVAHEGCIDNTEMITLSDPDAVIISIDDPQICFDGSTLFDLTSLEPMGMTGGNWTDYMMDPISSTMITPGNGHVYNYTYLNPNGCSSLATITLTVNNTPTLSDAFVCMGASVTMSGSGSANAASPYTSSDTGVATILPTGIVTPVSAGSATITYTDENGCQVDATLTVHDLPTASTGVMPQMCLGSDNFTITGSPVPGTGETGTWSAGTGILSSVDASAGTATFNASVLVAGIYQVTYTFIDANGCRGVDMGTVLIYNNPILPADASICIGATVDMMGSGTTPGTTPYTSSETGVATVTATGTVTGVTAGTTIITYKDANGCTATATVTVYGLPTIDNAIVCENATVTVSGSGTANATDPYISGDTDIATVSSAGVVNGKMEGSTTITYTDENGCQAIATITVLPAPAGANIDDISVCGVHSVFPFTVNDSGGAVSHFTVDFDAAAIAAGLQDMPASTPIAGGQFASTTPLAAGIYHGVIFLVSDNGCSVEHAFTITIRGTGCTGTFPWDGSN